MLCTWARRIQHLFTGQSTNHSVAIRLLTSPTLAPPELSIHFFFLLYFDSTSYEIIFNLSILIEFYIKSESTINKNQQKMTGEFRI